MDAQNVVLQLHPQMGGYSAKAFCSPNKATKPLRLRKPFDRTTPPPLTISLLPVTRHTSSSWPCHLHLWVPHWTLLMEVCLGTAHPDPGFYSSISHACLCLRTSLLSVYAHGSRASDSLRNPHLLITVGDSDYLFLLSSVVVHTWTHVEHSTLWKSVITFVCHLLAFYSLCMLPLRFQIGLKILCLGRL